MFLSLPPNFSDSSSSSGGSDAGQSDDSSDESMENVVMNAFAMATANSDLQTNSILVASFAAIKNKARASTEATSELAARVFDAVLAPKGPGSGNGPRRPAREFHRDRAVLCINQDWLGPEPLFRDNKFQRQFRVTKDIFRRMEEELPFHNGFFPPGQGCYQD